MSQYYKNSRKNNVKCVHKRKFDSISQKILNNQCRQTSQKKKLKRTERKNDKKENYQ